MLDFGTDTGPLQTPAGIPLDNQWFFVFKYHLSTSFLSLAVKSKSPLFDGLKKLLLILWLQFLLGLLPSSAALANMIVERPICSKFEQQKQVDSFRTLENILPFKTITFGLPILGIALIGPSTILRKQLR
jgi:hypothetical protein